MMERNTTVTRRRFLVTSMMGVAGVSAAPLAGGQLDVATYRALGLHEPPDLGGVSAEDFARFHPGGALGRRLTLQVEDVMVGEN